MQRYFVLCLRTCLPGRHMLRHQVRFELRQLWVLTGLFWREGSATDAKRRLLSFLALLHSGNWWLLPLRLRLLQDGLRLIDYTTCGFYSRQLNSLALLLPNEIRVSLPHLEPDWHSKQLSIFLSFADDWLSVLQVPVQERVPMPIYCLLSQPPHIITSIAELDLVDHIFHCIQFKITQLVFIQVYPVIF